MTGPSLVASAPHLSLVIGPAAHADVVAACRAAFSGGAGFEELLDALGSAGRAGIPPFAIAATEGRSVRLLLRGDVTVRDVADGTAYRAPQGLSTWREEVVSADGDVSFELDGAEVLLWIAGPVDGRGVENGATEAERADDRTLVDLAEPDAAEADEPPAAMRPDPAAHDDAADGIDQPEAEDVTRRDAGPPGVPSTPPPGPPVPTSQPWPPPAGRPSGGPPPVGAPQPTTQGSVPDAPDGAPRPTRQLIVGVPPAGEAGPADGGPTPTPAARTDELDDGVTLRRPTAEDGAGGPADVPVGAAGGVASVICPGGHANPPQSTDCRTCGQAVIDRSIRLVPRPVVARLRFDDGSVVDLDRPHIIGRRPTIPQDSDLGSLVGLYTVPDRDKELSRNHLEIHIDGWSITVMDLGSVNGTWVANPGKEPVRIRAQVEQTVALGATVRLADIASFVVEPPA